MLISSVNKEFKNHPKQHCQGNQWVNKQYRHADLKRKSTNQ